jgi:tRNA (uracil-5-)-methyltransferase
MSESPKTGEVHTLPASELEQPAVKRPRLIGKKGVKGESKRARKRREKQKDLPEFCSTEDVLWRDVISVLGRDVVDQALEDGTEFDSPFEYHQDVELEVSSLCSNGTSLALHLKPSMPWIWTPPAFHRKV